MSPVIIYRFEDKDGYGPFTGKEGINCSLGPRLEMRKMAEPFYDGIKILSGWHFGFAGLAPMYREVPFRDIRLMAKHGIKLVAYMAMPPEVQWGKTQVAFLKCEATKVKVILW